MDDQHSLRDIAQPRCDDVVVAAAAFGPNAAGRHVLHLLFSIGQQHTLSS